MGSVPPVVRWRPALAESQPYAHRPRDRLRVSVILVQIKWFQKTYE